MSTLVNDISKMTVSKARQLLESKNISSRMLVEALLAKINEIDSDIAAYIDVDAEYALKQADDADVARTKGKKGKLLGVPIAIKDIINVKGHPCRCASRILEGYIAPYDATAILKMRNEGAVFLGRTNMDEFAMGSSTENSAYKITRNPVKRDRVPGGSSGGSAAAVAAGEALAALGTDTGGSIRQPAAFCGCVGLKPSYGRVSRYGLTAFASSLDQIGPITKNVEDAAILFDVIAGVDAMDSTTVDVPLPSLRFTEDLFNLRGLRLGLPREYFVEGIQPEVKNAVQSAIKVCADLGAEIEEVSLPHTEYAIACYYIIATAEASANLARFDGVRYGFRCSDAKDPIEMYKQTRALGFGSEVKRRIILGTYVLSSGYYDAYYLSALKVRTLIRQDFEAVFKKIDAILAPVTPTVAFKIGEKTGDPLTMYLNDILTAPANLAGVPSISVPCGWSSDGLPIGLQVIGDLYREDIVFRVAMSYERKRQENKT